MPLSITFLRFIHVVPWLSISVLIFGRLYPLVWVHCVLFLHSSTDGHLGCFHFRAIRSSAVNICLRVFAWTRFPSLHTWPSCAVNGATAPASGQQARYRARRWSPTPAPPSPGFPGTCSFSSITLLPWKLCLIPFLSVF